MPDNTNLTPIQTSWRRYTNGAKVLLIPQVDDRPLDQFLEFRDAVFVLVESEQFLAELNGAWTPFTDFPQMEIGNALILELNAFPRAVEVAQATQKPEEQKKGWRKMISRASTVSGSVRDIVKTLPPYAQGALTLFNELLDVFKA